MIGLVILVETATIEDMKYIGIDYGTKRIGIAMSDDSGIMAFPLRVISNQEGSILEIMRIVEDEAVNTVVIGRSLASSGAENPVMKEVKKFEEKLRSELYDTMGDQVEIVWQDEFGSTANVKAFDEMFNARGDVENKKGKGTKEEVYDDRAATLILQRYLDTHQAENRADEQDQKENLDNNEEKNISRYE